MFGFYRVAAAVPALALADPAENARRCAELTAQAHQNGAALVVFPECALTGYTCADLFDSSTLQDAAVDGLHAYCAATSTYDIITAIGLPLLANGRLYNCAVVTRRGEILGVVPKSFLPVYREFYEPRWFESGADIRNRTIRIGKIADVPFGVDLLFETDDWSFGIELCEDLWNVIPPSSAQALAGATVLLNLSASHELVAKSEYRRQLVTGQSARCIAAYVYASSGVGESTTDLVFGGHAMIAENGAILAQNTRFQREADLLCADIDCARLAAIRRTESSFAANQEPVVRRIAVGPVAGVSSENLQRRIDPAPFVPSDPIQRETRCQEIFSIQSAGLARRLSHTGCKRLVIGVSGGLDSTLAILVAHRTLEQLKLPAENLIAVTMPGFGTSSRTYDNAVELCNGLRADLREIDITAACRQHFRDIGHDPDVHDVTYENVQARERTQLLMDIANREGALVVGTGDLSEIALGWCTYNGDHMSMYAVNTSVPKTLIQYVICWEADRESAETAATLRDILDTPISPELLPPDPDGEIAQRTEDVIGPYALHDFFLYHAQKYGASPDKIQMLASHAFAGRYENADIAKWLAVFFRRFFSQQFKRSCMPDGPKVGGISLSPRGDWRMPSDARATAWQEPSS